DSGNRSRMRSSSQRISSPQQAMRFSQRRRVDHLGSACSERMSFRRNGGARSESGSARPFRTLNLGAADELGIELRRVKSPAGRELLRAAGRLGAAAMDAALARAVPGSSEAEVAAALIEHVVREGGAIYGVVVSSGNWSGTLAPSGGAAGVAGWTTRRLK